MVGEGIVDGRGIGISRIKKEFDRKVIPKFGIVG